MQILGNICVLIAGLVYAVPLQHLLWELSRKRDDGGGAIVGLIILVPMWLLLLVALLCATATGGFDWLKLGRSMLFTLVIAATLSMAAVTLLGLEIRLQGTLNRLIQDGPIRLLPVLTILLVIFTLNPKFAGNVPLSIFRLPGAIAAGLCLICCLGFLGYKLVARGGQQFAALKHVLGDRGEVTRENLARVTTLDVEQDFQELLGLADQFRSREVREAATARLRTHPKFLEALIAELNSGSEDKALAFIESAAFSPEERQQLAAPARGAMQRFTGEMESQMRYMPSARRKEARKWGTYLFESVAKKLNDNGVDFAPAIAAYEQAFVVSR